MTSPRIGNYAPIVIYGWRSPARSVLALYPPLGPMPVRVVGWRCPRWRPGRKGCNPMFDRRDAEEQRHDQKAPEGINLANTAGHWELSTVALVTDGVSL